MTIPVIAQDAGLYAAPPPPDAAFVRVLNTDTATEADVNVGAVSFAVPPAGLSPYGFVTRGSYDAAVPGGTLPVSFEAQKFYTILLRTGGDAVLEDAPIANPVHAGLYFYNTTDTPLDLKAKINGKQAAVFSAVAPGAAASREVNAFEVSFVLASGSATAFELPSIAMQRQQGVSVVAIQNGDAITAFQTVNAVANP
ncbi:MAG TPA: alginate O-acetyltransferase AlgF [Devosia sp.]|nr:alginate O-acetyltransferase AlgF [Devosia sp.]